MYDLFMKFMWFFIVKYVKEVIINWIVIGFNIYVYVVVWEVVLVIDNIWEVC